MQRTLQFSDEYLCSRNYLYRHVKNLRPVTGYFLAEGRVRYIAEELSSEWGNHINVININLWRLVKLGKSFNFIFFNKAQVKQKGYVMFLFILIYKKKEEKGTAVKAVRMNKRAGSSAWVIFCWLKL